MPQCSVFADKSKTFFCPTVTSVRKCVTHFINLPKKRKKSLLSDVCAGKQALNNVAIAVYSDL